MDQGFLPKNSTEFNRPGQLELLLVGLELLLVGLAYLLEGLWVLPGQVHVWHPGVVGWEKEKNQEDGRQEQEREHQQRQ